jgi:dTDP-glucose 4,6-dehydratase
MKKLLVTGGAGFIGSEFVRQGVERGYEIVVIDSLTYAGDLERLKGVEGKIKFYRADVADKGAVEEIFSKEHPDAVVHFAAESHVDRSILDPSPFIETNVKGTQVLLDASRRFGVERFVNISTDEVYGELGEEGHFTESSPLNPNSPYSVSKASADMLGRAYYRTYGLPVITVRPSNNYGYWQYPEKLIPVVILKALLNEPIPVYGTGRNVREWLFVADCADGIFKVLEEGKEGEVYNLGSGQERRNLQVVEKILELLDKPKSLIQFVPDRPGHDFRYSLDWSKLKNELGWTPKTSFEEGIEKTVNWYLKNLDWAYGKLDYLKKYWEKVYSKR